MSNLITVHFYLNFLLNINLHLTLRILIIINNTNNINIFFLLNKIMFSVIITDHYSHFFNEVLTSQIEGEPELWNRVKIKYVLSDKFEVFKIFFSSVFTVYSYSLYVKNYETPKNYFPWTFLEKAKCNERNNCIMFKDWRTLWKMVRYRMCSGILDSLSLPSPRIHPCKNISGLFSRLIHVQQIDPSNISEQTNSAI